MLPLGILCCAVSFVASYSTYSDDHFKAFIKTLPDVSQLDKYEGTLLAPLLVPRVSGTQGATDVRDWMKTFLTRNLSGWVVEEDRFSAQTPLAETEFVNLIATMDPPGFEESSIGRLVFAAHYDSKMLPPGFIGATDSSVPCSILLYIAQMLSQRLPLYWEEEYWADPDGLEESTPQGIQLIFFDGEEAVKEWTDEDSIYGARHLAERWESEMLLPSATSSRKSRLSSIDLFVLLDLLGAKDTVIPSFFSTTHWAYNHLAWIEELMRSHKIAQSQHGDHIFAGSRQQFQLAGQIGDDHIPFLEKGVQILHAIALPFPRVWHTMEDDADHLDQKSINDLAMIFSTFAAQWLELPTTPGSVADPSDSLRTGRAIQEL